LKSSDLIKKGWLPEYFPKTATNIVESHNIDTNRVKATFNYNISELSSVGAACRQIINSSEEITFRCPPFESEVVTLRFRKDGTGEFTRY